VEFQSAEIQALQEQIARDNGYKVVGHSLVLYVKPA
jgi:Fur family ferric uptake transcriptional regulator